MDVYKTHGAFSWAELTTPDPAAAASFYGGLFGWSVKEMGPEMGGYRVVSVGDAGVGRNDPLGTRRRRADAGPALAKRGDDPHLRPPHLRDARIAWTGRKPQSPAGYRMVDPP